MKNNKLIIWLLYIALCGYNILDVYLTNLLFKYGASEVNPLLLTFMRNPQDIIPIIIIKSILMGILGVCLYTHLKKKEI